MSTTAIAIDPILDQLLQLRCAGHSLSYCAAAVGITTAKATRLLEALAKELVGGREELIVKQRSQLEFLWRRTLQPFVADADAERLPLPEKVTATLLRILEREAKLFGLDAPTKVENSHSFDSASDAELLSEAKRLGIAGEAVAVLAAKSAEAIDPSPHSPPSEDDADDAE